MYYIATRHVAEIPSQIIHHVSSDRVVYADTIQIDYIVCLEFTFQKKRCWFNAHR